MILDKIKTDDFIANTIVDNTDIFKNIDPNWITMSGMMLNFGILYFRISTVLVLFKDRIIA